MRREVVARGSGPRAAVDGRAGAEEIQPEMRAERAFTEEFRRSNPSLLEARLRQERLEEAS